MKCKDCKFFKRVASDASIGTCPGFVEGYYIQENNNCSFEYYYKPNVDIIEVDKIII